MKGNICARALASKQRRATKYVSLYAFTCINIYFSALIIGFLGVCMYVWARARANTFFIIVMMMMIVVVVFVVVDDDFSQTLL